ncbi:MAG: TIGR01906 family membrane protein [Anaerolineaceae bacterium]|nr:TIGR01906 family membrane protein [Anaerolineaceae bacterium]
MNPILQRILTLLIAVMIPFFLLMTAIRLLFSPVFMQLEYRTPGFPADTYGFTLEDRLHWSRISLEYLLNNSEIEYLANQQLADGSPLYNERELSHMVDVKVLVQKMLIAWWILFVILLGLGLWAWRAGWQPTYLRGLGSGGRLTIGLIILILAAVAISFRALFTGFHQIFFSGDTWLFLYSDTLIRLFPIRFWQDGFIAMGIFTLLGAGALILLEKKLG